MTWRTFHDDPLRIESWNNEVGRTPQMTECWVLWLLLVFLLFRFINPSGILTGFILTAFILASAENGWERPQLHSAMLGRKARDWGTCVEQKTVGGFASLGKLLCPQHLVAPMDPRVLEISSFTPFAKMRQGIAITQKPGLGRAQEAKILLTFKASPFRVFSGASFFSCPL